MNEPKHTPAPWRITPWFDGKAMIVRGDPVELVIAKVEDTIRSPDALLIVAAPKLLAALDGLVRLLNGPADFTTQQITDAIRAGIEALQEAGVYE